MIFTTCNQWTDLVYVFPLIRWHSWQDQQQCANGTDRVVEIRPCHRDHTHNL